MALTSQGSADSRPRVVIVGAGFGGLAAAKRLAKQPVDVTIIDKRNYHLFQPLLYQVATAALSPADIAWPIRSIFSRAANVHVVLGKVVGIDFRSREVISDRVRVPFDYLILATGSYHSYFGHDGWARYAPGLKRVIDATEIRKRILLAFELAELAPTEAERRRELTFVIIGGGPTGVELAGAIGELARHTLASDFRNINPRSARIMLVEGTGRLLPAFPPSLSDYARKALEKLGVDVILNKMVEVRGEEGAAIGDQLVPAATMIWAAGVKVPHLKNWLPAETDRSGRVLVAPDLSLPEHPNIFVIGDAAAVPWQDGQMVPGIAPPAKQEGGYVANVILAAVKGRQPPGPFRYRHQGNLATIGRNSAIADFGWVKLTGVIGWWVWGIAHIYFLIGVRAPMLVALEWLWSYLTFGRGARLITGLSPQFEDLDLHPSEASEAKRHVKRPAE